LSTLVTLWWLSFWTILGLCLGSFLNAVIYRIPRHRSLRSPLWSACPYCCCRIEWYDNLPIISFILLGGRCRHCGVPISTRYLVIETGMAIVVLMLLDAFLIGHVRLGLSASEFGLTDRLAYDWPILVSHIILFACLLAMSAIDLEHYWVDIRFTNIVTIVGFALHALWTPKHSMAWVRPFDATAVMSLFAVVGLGIVWVVLACQTHDATAATAESTAEDPAAFDTTSSTSGARLESRTSGGGPPRSLASPSRVAGWIGVLLLVGLFVVLFFDAWSEIPISHPAGPARLAPRALLPLVMFFLLIVSESTVKRESDQAIMDAIHEERHTARRTVVSELVLLLPAIALGAVGLWIMSGDGGLNSRISSALHAPVHFSNLALLRHWTPLYGLATAASGYVIAGAVGWAVRIVFTLLFGKEAFGVGDIHLMAAAGCVAGWPIVVLGFFLTCGLAMVGWIVSLPFKRTRALPLGPWLSLSFLIIVVFYEPIIQWPPIDRAIVLTQSLISENSQLPRNGIFP
jgi:prepilin signal peptidase PulO-like enzyme (type II secretory pathway)